MTTEATLTGGDKPVLPEGVKDLDKTVEATAEPEKAKQEAEQASEGTTEQAAPEGDKAKSEDEIRKAKAEKTRERIQDLSRRARDAEERAAALEKRVEELTAARPKEGDFSDPAEFDRASLRHAVKEARADELKAEREQAARQAADAKKEIWQEQVTEARAVYSDFDAVALNPNLPISQTMGDVIADSQRGADIAYFLGKNPDEAKRIAGMPPIQAARELGRIEAELTPKPRKISNAPPPVETVGSRGSGNDDPAGFSIAQMRKHLGIGQRR